MIAPKEDSRVVRSACALALSLFWVYSHAATLSHLPDPMFHDGMEGPTAGPFNDSDAARFLAQATFGPNDADIADLRARGYQGWLDRQIDPVQTPPSSQLAYFNWVSKPIASGGLGENTGYSDILEAWFLGALGGPDPQFPGNVASNHNDQLRQRVAFALSEILVISDQNTLIDQHPDGQAYFYDILSNNAFANFRTLLKQVTLSPAMGVYLNMQGNPRANLSQNLHPDENYAREINQLFSVGLVMLNEDGTPQLDGFGKPIPTYNQAVVTAFAHVFTGWNWADCSSGNFSSCGYHGLDFQVPMVSFPAHHDNGTDSTNDIACKHLLSYGTYQQPGAAANSGTCFQSSADPNPTGYLSSGGTPATDLAFALDNIFNHPNVGVFIGKQLIQRLVTSNPSPEYVQRITAVFNNDGFGTRGNLGAVVRAILLDPEARYGQVQDPESFGKLREPLLRITHFWRAMGARHQCGGAGYANGDYANAPYRYAGYDLAYGTNDTIYGNGVGQAPIKADTVFNFFKPGYMPSGEMAAAGLLGPEFQINTDTLISNSTNAIFDFYAAGFDVSDAPGCSGYGPPGEVAIDRSPDMTFLTANGNGALIDRYNKIFMSGQMSPFMRQTLLTYMSSLGGSSKQRVNALLMLILTSPEYMIQK